MAKAATKTMRYADAMQELEEILRDMEEERLGIDELAPRVERAAELIAWCRGVLERTGLRVQEAVQGLSEEEGAAPADEDGR